MRDGHRTADSVAFHPRKEMPRIALGVCDVEAWLRRCSDQRVDAGQDPESRS